MGLARPFTLGRKFLDGKAKNIKRRKFYYREIIKKLKCGGEKTIVDFIEILRYAFNIKGRSESGLVF